jgi:maltooligosyltrehalose trehalohydrolase
MRINEPHTWKLGSTYDSERKLTQFLVWAPKASTLELETLAPHQRTISMKQIGKEQKGGYFFLETEDAQPGTRYFFKKDGKLLPDPASRFQPHGVHGPSEVVPSEFAWEDEGWEGVNLKELVLYEIHTGTFSDKRTFEGIIDDLPRLKALGINAIEVMPVAQFSGSRNWGYDGVFPFSTQNTYGGPHALKQLVNATHLAGMAIFLDVVYNHLGPEGNILPELGYYFHDRYHTPWGDALNFDGPHSDDVRRYFLQNAEQWLDEFHFDGLRLDAIQSICDLSALPFLEELTSLKASIEAKRKLNLFLIGETDSNDSRVVAQKKNGGLGLDGHWNDDFHHTIHAFLTQEQEGYYEDYGSFEQIYEIYCKKVLFENDYSTHLKRRRGRSYENTKAHLLTTCIQNHDQIGNRMLGERLSTLISFEELKLAIGCLFISPFMPLIFMGDEYGEKAPFLYFVDHLDLALLKAVREGRKREFSAFGWDKETPDPGSPQTFKRSCLKRPIFKNSFSENKKSDQIQSLYSFLIPLSKWLRRIDAFEKKSFQILKNSDQQYLEFHLNEPEQKFSAFFNFGTSPQVFTITKQKLKLDFILDSSLFPKEPPHKDLFLEEVQIEVKPKSFFLYRGTTP